MPPVWGKKSNPFENRIKYNYQFIFVPMRAAIDLIGYSTSTQRSNNTTEDFFLKSFGVYIGKSWCFEIEQLM